MARGRKQVSFDLDTNMLKAYYPNENWRKAYINIRSFMLNEGFQWQQGSVYISSESLTEAETTAIIKKFIEQEPWLNVCMRDCVVANIGRSHSQNYLFDKNIDIQPRAKAAEADKVMDIVTDVVFSRAAYFENDEIEDEIER